MVLIGSLCVVTLSLGAGLVLVARGQRNSVRVDIYLRTLFKAFFPDQQAKHRRHYRQLPNIRRLLGAGTKEDQPVIDT